MLGLQAGCHSHLALLPLPLVMGVPPAELSSLAPELALWVLLLLFETGSFYVALAVLELSI